MHISEHPDFKVTKQKSYCSECKADTEHHRFMRLNSPDGPPECFVCQVCGFDREEEDWIAMYGDFNEE